MTDEPKRMPKEIYAIYLSSDAPMHMAGAWETVPNKHLCKYIRAEPEDETYDEKYLSEEITNLLNAIEGMPYGVFRDENGHRLKDTSAWVDFYNKYMKLKRGDMKNLEPAPKEKVEGVEKALDHINTHGLISGDHLNFERMSDGEFNDIFITIEKALLSYGVVK